MKKKNGEEEEIGLKFNKIAKHAMLCFFLLCVLCVMRCEFQIYILYIMNSIQFSSSRVRNSKFEIHVVQFVLLSLFLFNIFD